MIRIVPETPALHAEGIETLYDATFGPGHFAKTAERLREGTVSLPHLTRVALWEEEVIGVCRIWPVEVGNRRDPALFVGPVAMDYARRGARLGLSVTLASLQAARHAGWPAAIIIGSPSYFGAIGFEPVPAGRLIMPAPQDPARVMVRSLAGDANALQGRVQVPRDPAALSAAFASPGPNNQAEQQHHGDKAGQERQTC